MFYSGHETGRIIGKVYTLMINNNTNNSDNKNDKRKQRTDDYRNTVLAEKGYRKQSPNPDSSRDSSQRISISQSEVNRCGS